MISLFTRYAPRANVPDSNYPLGSIKNESIPGADDGTPLEKDWGNNIEGFHQALMAEAGITASGNPDKVGSSQLLDAVRLVANPPANSIADLRLLKGGSKVLLTGYYSYGDGGGGLFYWDQSSTLADDAAMIIKPTSVTGAGRFIRVGYSSGGFNGKLYVEMFGVIGNGLAGYTARAQAAINYAAGRGIEFLGGVYLLDPLTVPATSNTAITGRNSILKLNSPGSLISINGSGTEPNVNIKLDGFIFHGNDKTGSVLLDIQHVHGVKVENCQGFDVKGTGSYHVRLRSAWVTEFDNCYFQAAASKCEAILLMDGANQQCNFMNTRFLSNTGGSGIVIKDSINNNFRGCDSEGNDFGVKITASSGQRCDVNSFTGCDFEENIVTAQIGSTGDPVIGTAFRDCANIGTAPNTGGEIYIDNAAGTVLDNISIGNCKVTTTARAKRTEYKKAYGGTPTEGVLMSIADTKEWIDRNISVADFLPTVRSDSGGTPSAYSVQVGSVVRNGRTATVSGTVYWTGWAAPTGNLQLVMPFKFRNLTNLNQVVNLSSGGGGFTYTAGNQIVALGVPNTNYANVYQFNSTTRNGVAPSASGVIDFNATYQIEDI